MKHFILIFITFITTLAFSQVKIVTVEDLDTDVVGQELEAIGDVNDIAIYKDLRVINTSSQSIGVVFQRDRTANSGALDQICDEFLCHDCDDVFTFSTPIQITIAPGDTTLFKPQVVPGGNEICGIHTYTVTSQFGNPYGTVTVKFRTENANCFLNTQTHETTDFNVYPNPTAEFVSVNFEGGQKAMLNITDALGKKVLESNVSSGEKVNVNHLKNGVYFVKLSKSNGEAINTKRLIIKK